MDKTTFEYDNPGPGKLFPGHWTDVTRDGQQTAKIACPDCGQEGTLDPREHGILGDGEVVPSVVCDCGYHENITLRDWARKGLDNG